MITCCFLQEWFILDKEGKITVNAFLNRELVTGINYTIQLTSPRSRPGQRSIGSLMVTIFEVSNIQICPIIFLIFKLRYKVQQIKLLNFVVGQRCSSNSDRHGDRFPRGSSNRHCSTYCRS